MDATALYKKIRRLGFGEAEGVYRYGHSVRIDLPVFLRALANRSNPPITHADGRMVENASRRLAAILPLKTRVNQILDEVIAEANEVYEAGASDSPQAASDTDETDSRRKSRKSRRKK
jgi:hypothetical protein